MARRPFYFLVRVRVVYENDTDIASLPPMHSYGDLLCILYDGLEKELFRANASKDTLNSPSLEDSLNDADEDAERAIDLENQKEFLRWELKLYSRSIGTHDTLSGDPAISEVGQKKILAELQYFEKRLRALRDSSSAFSDGSTSEVDFKAVRGYAQHVKQYGQCPEGVRDALRPKLLTEYRSGVDRVTGINETSERSRQQEATVAANEGSRQRISSHADGMEKIHKHDRLYSLLAERTNCGNTIHRVILPCRGTDFDDYQVDLILSVCKDYSHGTRWLETRLAHERKDTSSSNRSQINLCSEIRRFYAHKCPLSLSFDGFALSNRPRSQETNEVPLQTPMKLTLDELFQEGGFRDESLEIRLKKSRLALQLGILLQRLYPGPWIQQNWTTKMIQTLGSVSQTQRVAPDLSRVGIPCILSTEWESTNAVWCEFFNAQDFKKEYFCRFFLSFAQLLVDVSDGCPTTTLSASVEDEGVWYDELLEKAHQLQHNKLLQWYGRAVEVCAKFALDYHASFRTVENPRHRAQKVIQENIVRNLHENTRLWEDEWDRHSRALRSETMEQNETNTNKMSSQRRDEAQKSTGIPTVAPVILDQDAPKFFRLFAGVDKESLERRPGDTEDNDFIKLMRTFTANYLLFPRPTGRPIRIAVLDTGLHINEEDTLLLGGAKRVLPSLSRNYAGAGISQGAKSDYVDTDGHGTHVTRLLLRLTQCAEVVVIKISNGPILEHSQTTLRQVADALEWAAAVHGADADIINLSFGLDEAAKETMSPVIQRLVRTGKLVFAAASNSGGNGRRAYPARDTGVFAIHATNFEGTSPEGLNPPCVGADLGDNFATLGYQIPSHWDGKDLYVTGTSFATPVAAAIAANILDFVRRAPPEFQSSNPQYFFNFGGMRRVFLRLSSRMGNYDYVRPWNEGMFDNELSIEQIYRRLQQMSVIHDDRELDRLWLKTRDSAFEGRVKEWAGAGNI